MFEEGQTVTPPDAESDRARTVQHRDKRRVQANSNGNAAGIAVSGRDVQFRDISIIFWNGQRKIKRAKRRFESPSAREARTDEPTSSVN